MRSTEVLICQLRLVRILQGITSNKVRSALHNTVTLPTFSAQFIFYRHLQLCLGSH